MSDRHSIVGFTADGRRTTLCVNVGTDAEAQSLAASLRELGDYHRIEVVVEKGIESAKPWTPPPIDVEQVVQRRKEISRRKSRKSEMGRPAFPVATMIEVAPAQKTHGSENGLAEPSASRPTVEA